MLQELQDMRDKYKQQARELKDAVAKQKIAIEQYTDTNDLWVAIPQFNPRQCMVCSLICLCTLVDYIANNMDSDQTAPF